MLEHAKIIIELEKKLSVTQKELAGLNHEYQKIMDKIIINIGNAGLMMEDETVITPAHFVRRVVDKEDPVGRFFAKTPTSINECLESRSPFITISVH
jgi:hypothetical protein